MRIVARLGVVASIVGISGGALAQTTPLPTTAFTVPSVGFNGLGPTDPMIAASPTMVVVAQYNGLDYLEKNGAPLQPPVNIVPLFQAAGAPVPNINQTGDMRILWDEFRHRFWIMAASTNNQAATNPCMVTSPCTCSQDDNWAIAVSITDDPRLGWYGYYYPIQSFGPLYHVASVTDFPSIGIDEVGFYITGNVHPPALCPTAGTSYSRVLALSADDMAAGLPQSSVRSEEYVNWTGSDGVPISYPTPTTHHGTTMGTDGHRRAFFTNHPHQADGTTTPWLDVFTILDPLSGHVTGEPAHRVPLPNTSTTSVAHDSPQLGTNAPLLDTATNDWNDHPDQAVFRDGHLHLVANDAGPCGSFGAKMVNHYVKIAVPGYVTETDRQFGCENIRAPRS